MLEELRLFSNYARDSKGHLEILLVGARVVDASHGAVAAAVSSAYLVRGRY
jgi:type II secretory pathway predicted ATPase ExeA